MNGESQDVDMSTEVIDRIFEEVVDSETISIVGGEPLLALDALEYFLDKVIEHKWHTKYIQMTTNGTIRNLRVIQILQRFCKSCWKPWNKRKVLIRISSDSFHNPEEYNQTMQFYKAVAGPIPEIHIILSGEIGTLRLSGRAQEYIGEYPEAGKKYFLGLQCRDNYRVKIVDGEVQCRIQIGANGNIGLHQGQDFNTFDSLSFGNILDESMSAMIEKNNANSLLTCGDSVKLDTARNWYYTYISRVGSAFQDADNIEENKFLNMLMTHNAEVLLMRIVHLRNKAREMYPYLPAQDILDAFPFPSNILEYVVTMAPKMLKGFLVTEIMIENSVDAQILKDFYAFQNPSPFFIKQGNEMLRLWAKFAYTEFDDTDLEKTDVFKMLKQLNDWYRDGEFVPNNNKKYPCPKEVAKRLGVECEENVENLDR